MKNIENRFNLLNEQSQRAVSALLNSQAISDNASQLDELPVAGELAQKTSVDCSKITEINEVANLFYEYLATIEPNSFPNLERTIQVAFEAIDKLTYETASLLDEI